MVCVSVDVTFIDLHVEIPAGWENRDLGTSHWIGCLEGIPLNKCMFPTSSPSC